MDRVDIKSQWRTPYAFIVFADAAAAEEAVKNIVDEQNFRAADPVRVFRLVHAQHIAPPLGGGGQPGLRGVVSRFPLWLPPRGASPPVPLQLAGLH